MILGLNTNHDHNGKVFHVQTEDSGVDNPVVVTHCFIGGTIIATRRAEYGDALERDDLEDHIRRLARGQHREMVQSLIRGEFDKAAHLAGRGAGRGDIPLARDGRAPRRSLAPVGPERSMPPPVPGVEDSDESIEQLDSVEMQIVDDGPILSRELAEPIEFQTPLLDPTPLDPVLLAYLLEDDTPR